MGRGDRVTLIGQFQHAVDEKGRLTIPAKFREELGARFVLTVGLDKCLACYPFAEWEQLQAKLAQLPLSNRDARQFQRFLQAGAVEAEVDRQGRILLPQTLRALAGLDGDAVLIGLTTRVEIWSEAVWRPYQTAAEKAFEEIAEKMADFGL